MKYLSNYTEDATSEALEKAGAFFAFGQKQFEEAKKEGIKYIDLGAGLIAPEATAQQLIEDMGKALENGIAQDIKENGMKAIIIRELYNHESFYTGDIESTVSALSGYNFKIEVIMATFREEKQKAYEAEELAEATEEARDAVAV